ncbi:MAG: hypothetical protein JKY48_01350 [Flavobacteriales bacterium]|nr:hypothetical protein [Flavobacteriales bacterium]
MGRARPSKSWDIFKKKRLRTLFSLKSYEIPVDCEHGFNLAFSWCNFEGVVGDLSITLRTSRCKKCWDSEFNNHYGKSSEEFIWPIRDLSSSGTANIRPNKGVKLIGAIVSGLAVMELFSSPEIKKINKFLLKNYDDRDVLEEEG